MNIRPSTPQELDVINTLYKTTFDPSEADVVAKLACDLIKDPSAQPLVSLVAEQDGTVIGHVIFSVVTIEGSESLSAYILAPLVVSASCQKQGIGTQLIRQGLEALKVRGCDIVFVYGDPSYYNRTGFKAGHAVAAPYTLQYPDAWMALALTSDAFTAAKGIACCGDALMSPELW